MPDTTPRPTGDEPMTFISPADVPPPPYFRPGSDQHITPTFTTAAIRDAFQQAAKVAQRYVDGMREAFERAGKLMSTLRERANEPAHVAGLEGRYFVRGAMDPTYTTEDALCRLLESIMTGESDLTLLLTRENRATVAAAAVRGWVEFHDVDAEPLCWHRYLDGTRIEVRA